MRVPSTAPITAAIATLRNFFGVAGCSGTSARYGGTGLGLVISRGYCELMRGTLEVESVAGRGSVFTVRLPARLERRAGGR